MMLVLFFAIVTLISWLVLRFRRINRFIKDVPSISFDSTSIFKIGNGNMSEAATQISNSYERIGKAWLGPMFVTICIDHPDDLQTILNSKDCLDKSYMYRFMPAGDGLLTANAQMWKFHRKHYNDGFSINALSEYVTIFNNEVGKLIQKLDNMIDAPAFDISEYLYASNAQTIFRTAMNVETNILNAGEYVNWMLKAVQRILEIAAQRFENLILHPTFIFQLTNKYREQKKLVEQCTQLIAMIQDECTSKVRRQREQDVGTEKDSADFGKRDNFILKTIVEMQQSGVIDTKMLQDHINTILVAGTDTTTLTVSAALMMLAIHPDVQEKARQEVVNASGENASYYDLNTISKLNYVECILKETMRLYPVVATLGRTTTADVKLQTHTIPKNTVIVMFINKTQRNPKFWGPNANQFDPDRFSSENSVDRHPYVFLAFSNGPRKCIGSKYAMISMKIQLCHLLTHFQFITDVQMDDIRMKFNVVMRFADGYKLRIVRRQSDSVKP